MKRALFEMHWQYYLTIENMLVKTSQYVMHSEKNKHTYSDEFASIILLSCSEIDALLKQLCISNGVQRKEKYYKMKDYAIAIEGCDEYGLATGIHLLDNDQIATFPFRNIDISKPHANLIWWKDYQSIKHDRIKNIEKGNLLNAVNSVAAQYIILFQLMNFLDATQGQDYIKKNYHSEYWIPIA